MGERPVQRFVQICKARQEESTNVVESSGRMEVGAERGSISWFARSQSTRPRSRSGSGVLS